MQLGGSIGTITFKAYTVKTGDEKGSLSTPPTYIRHLHGKTLKGSWSMSTAVGQALELCSLHLHGSQSGCTDLTITKLSPNHIELQDSHGDTIRLMRNGMPQIANPETDCSRTDLTQDERYTCGYNHGYLDAQTDWNLNRGEDNSCPHATEHTPEYCNGYANGYTYEWNALYQSQQTPTGPSLDALYNKGLSLSYLGNHTGAIEYYDKALTIDPQYVHALDNKGTALENLGNNTGAILYYDKVLAIDPHYDTALNNKGPALDNLGNYTGAIEFYNKALTIDPNNTFALTNKDAILHMLGNNTTPGNATNFLEYENSTYGIKIHYPSDWRVEGASNSSIVASFYPQANNAGYVTVQINNLTTNYTPDQYLNSLMLGDAADYKDFPDMRFNQNTTNNIVLAGHPGYLLNGTFRDPTSDALQRFTNIGTIIGDRVYSVITKVDLQIFMLLDYLN